MKWTLREIRDYPEDLMFFKEELDLEVALKAKDSSIISAKPALVEGFVTVVGEAYLMQATIQVDLVLPSSRSLQAVDLSLSIPITERYVLPDMDIDQDGFEETIIVLDHDYIDLDDAVVDSIIINIPNRVLAPGEEAAPLPSGKDWEVLTEDQYEERLMNEKDNQVDPRFAALKTLLKEDQ